MTLALVPHIPTPTASDQLHLWVGVADMQATPQLQWKLNGSTPNVRALRPLSPVLRDDFAASAPPVFTGFYEITGLQPDTEYVVVLDADGESVERKCWTLPASVPSDTQDRLNILLLSCFHRLEDKTGMAGMVLSQIKIRPHLTLFMGDQVYLDLPTIQDFGESAAWLGNKFQNDYVDNWFGMRLAPQSVDSVPCGFPEILALAPAAFLPDDHEYWNNYPYASAFIQNTWGKKGQRIWREAAELAYQGFQQSAAVPFGRSRTITIDPLSILLLDTRSQRHPTSRDKAGDLIGNAGRGALTQWADDIIRMATTTPRYGMLVTGQSMFCSAVGAVKGKIADFEFPDYEADYNFMVKQLERVVRSGVPVVCLTGDVHWGRILRAQESSGQTASVYEVISSPTSLVSTVFADQAASVWAAIRGMFGSVECWPRHSDPSEPPPRFGSVSQYATEVVPVSSEKMASTRGNHAIMLRLARAGMGLRVEATCYPLHQDSAINFAEQWSTSFDLRPIS